MATRSSAPLERQFGNSRAEPDDIDQLRRIVCDCVCSSLSASTSTSPKKRCSLRLTPRRAFCRRAFPSPPVYSKTNPADAPVLTLAITSDSIPLSQVEDMVDTRLAPKLSQLSGVGLVSISGGQKPAVRIQANPSALSSYGLNLEDCARRSRRPASMPPRETSTDLIRIIRSTPNDQW